jgi:hypothetical protein
MISTAPYGTVRVRGTVYEVAGATYGEEDGALLEEPTTLKLRNTAIYSTTSYSWGASGEMELDMPVNSIILSNGKLIKPSEIKKGDTVTVIKRDSALTGDAYIIMVD